MFALYLILFILGLAVGSFLNVLIDRLPQGKSPWKGRSQCDYCKHELSVFDLIPLFSYAWLKGRCRYCHKRLSRQHPLIEFVTGLMFILTYLYSLYKCQLLIINCELFFIGLLVIFSSLLVIFVADFKYQIIPDEMVLMFLLGTVFLLLFSPVSWVVHIISAVGAFIFFLSIYLLTKGKGMGLGDVKLAFGLGLWLGYPQIVIGLYLAFLTGAIVSIILILLKKKSTKERIAFGPFLIMGSSVGFFAGESIFIMYASLLK